jgi:hypothetical protein
VLLQITPLVVGLVGNVAGAGVSRGLTPPIRFPRIPTGAIGQAATIVRNLTRRGLRARTTTGPFGNLVVGTEDQDLDTLAQEAAFRNLNQEVLTELLQEDPLLFIRNLPVGDPRRVRVGLDPPGTAGLFPPSASAGPGLSGGDRQQLAIVPIISRRTTVNRRPAFSVRSLTQGAIR